MAGQVGVRNFNVNRVIVPKRFDALDTLERQHKLKFDMRREIGKRCQRQRKDLTLLAHSTNSAEALA